MNLVLLIWISLFGLSLIITILLLALDSYKNNLAKYAFIPGVLSIILLFASVGNLSEYCINKSEIKDIQIQVELYKESPEHAHSANYINTLILEKRTEKIRWCIYSYSKKYRFYRIITRR